MNYTVWTISLCYQSPDVIERSLERFRLTTSPNVHHNLIMVDQHWPINRPETRKRLEAIAERVGATLIDPGSNLGLHGGFNWAWSQQNIPDNAMVMGYDPDSWPVESGWDAALCDVFNARPGIGWFSLWHVHATRELFTDGKRGKELVLAGHRAVEAARPCMNSICGFRQSYLRQAGGLFEQNHFYGGLECDMWAKLKALGFEWFFLRDFSENEHLKQFEDVRYRDWKWAYAHLKTTKDDFGTWLAKR